jgi:DNA-binding MarR family transcriptional regulator
MTSTGDLRAWELLVRFHRRATRAMDANLRRRFDLGLDDYDVLHQLREADGPVAMTELAARLLVANSSCTRLVGRLVDRGVVERRSDPADGRQVLVTLTGEGRRLHRRMAAVHTRDIRALMVDRMSVAERQMVEAALARLADDGGGALP